MNAALKHVPQHGWTTEAVIAALQQDYPHVSTSLASQITPAQLVAHVMDEWNAQLERELQQQPSMMDHNDSIPQRITFALQTRLRYQTEWVRNQQWHPAMALGLTSNPWQTSQQLQTLMRMVLQHGYQGRDLPHETSQIALGAVYVAAELHMLADRSVEFVDTWNFLEQRVDDWYRGSQTASSFLPHSDAGLLASTVAAAVSSGVQSMLLTNHKIPPSSPPSAFDPLATTTQAVVEQALRSGGASPPSVDGTHPNHYQSSSLSSSSSTSTTPPKPTQQE